MEPERAGRRATVPAQSPRGDARSLRPGCDRDAPVHRRAGAHALGLRRATRRRSTTCACGTTGRCSRRSGSSRSFGNYYTFSDVDIDRYLIDDEQREIMLSARELDVELFGTDRTWTNERLVYTHGYGITAVPVDAVTAAGTPDYLVSGIDREPDLPITQPRIYFGEETDTYIVTSTTTAEFDYPRDTDEGGEDRGRDDRVGGDDRRRHRQLLQPAPLRAALRRLQPAHQQPADRRLRDPVPARHRGARPRDRAVPRVRPRPVSRQLRWSAAVGLGRLHRHRSLSERPAPGSDTRFAGANYLRNSVKVVVDAYNGTVSFYLADPDEPIAAAYARIFPGLFEPIDAMPEELRAHLRYPEDLFVAQNQAFRLYHLPATENGARRPSTTRTTDGRSPRTSRPARPADGAVLRDHAHPRRGCRRVRPHPADGPRRAART